MNNDTWFWPKSQIIDVVDGDTVDTVLTRDVDLGFHITSRTALPFRLRLNRINTAKASSTRGKAARELVVAKTSGTTVDITTIKSYKFGGPRGKVAEYMAEVVLPDGTNLSDLLVAEGLAVPWDGQGERPADA
jgi:endonuclease YncB( thermonuclease family)